MQVTTEKLKTDEKQKNMVWWVYNNKYCSASRLSRSLICAIGHPVLTETYECDVKYDIISG